METTMRLSISEIMEQANKIKDSEERRKFILQNDSQALRTIIQYCYHPQVKWLLPKGEPPYKPSEHVESQGMLYGEARKLYLFVEGGNDALTKTKREQLYIQMLESLDKNDAKILASIKDKKLPYKYLTKIFFERTFPGLLG